ncbi:MAG: YggS family pyridoxal phosphate-dependent enzyme [Balneolaceae bacterium]|nr:YggS family pyridoxal phosphate-dependent enzyme [Balneolaceae bacterium]
MSEDICQNLEKVWNRIGNAGRDPDEITLVAVSKTKPVEDVLRAFDCGQVHFGENRAKQLQDKMDAIDQEEIEWHMVGPLQTNKIKYMVERVNWIESVPKEKTLREIEKRASRIGRTINTLIQVNISEEDQKSGCMPDELAGILEYAQGYEFTVVRGLMGIASLVEDPEEVRPEFRLLSELLEEHKSYECENIQLDHLSMGMTNDLEVAIEEGATMVRVGRAIFGERNY